MADKPKRKITDKEIEAKGYRKEGLDPGFIKYRKSDDKMQAQGLRFEADTYKDKAAVEEDINSLSLRKLPAYKKGGVVKKTGPAMVHKGEVILTPKQANQIVVAQNPVGALKCVREMMGMSAAGSKGKKK